MPLPIEAMVHTAKADDAVTRALVARHNLVIEAVRAWHALIARPPASPPLLLRLADVHLVLGRVGVPLGSALPRGAQWQSLGPRRYFVAAAGLSPSATIAACTAGRAATRAWNASRLGNADRSSFTMLAQLVTTNRYESATVNCSPNR